MFYIVGLGNPGKEYSNTRHNIGFAVAEAFVVRNQFSSWHNSSVHSGRVSKGTVDSTDVVVLLPSTFMNASGNAVKKLLPQSEANRLIVMYDDIDLPLGTLKVSFSRGAGGHNGVQSIINALGTEDFIRLRIGIAQKSIWTGKIKRPKGEALAQFVLAPFKRGEQKELDVVIMRACDALRACVTKGKENAMNTYN